MYDKTRCLVKDGDEPPTDSWSRRSSAGQEKSPRDAARLLEQLSEVKRKEEKQTFQTICLLLFPLASGAKALSPN